MALSYRKFFVLELPQSFLGDKTFAVPLLSY